MRPHKQLVTLLARKPGSEWMIRQRFNDEHTAMRGGKITRAQLIDRANSALVSWAANEPATEFQLEIHR